QMGKADPSLGGKLKKSKIPNKLKKEAKDVRTKGPIDPPVAQMDEKGLEFFFVGFLKLSVCNFVYFLLIYSSFGNLEMVRHCPKIGETCWAIVLARLLQSAYNLSQNGKEQNCKTFSHQDLVQHLKSTETKKTGKKSSSLPGSDIGNKEKWEFTAMRNVSVDFVRSKVDASPVGIAFELGPEFYGIKKGIYTVGSTVEGEEGELDRHMMIIVGYGYTTEGKLFFVVQNSWGKDNWGVEGFGRIIIDDKSSFVLIYPSY
ncbi:hypothetical protein EUTSA_v10009679mg, partial [Eutrema salsugineum]